MNYGYIRVSSDKQTVENILNSIGIEPSVRGEKLGIKEFALISDEFESFGSG